MGLGGITRDSIVGLNKLVHDDDDEPPRHNRRRSDGNGLSGSWNSGKKKDGSGDNDFLLLDLEDTTESQGSFETSLNDRLSSDLTLQTRNNVGAVSSSATTPRSSAAVAAATSYSKVSATNSRSLDSYRSQNVMSPDSAQAAHYQGLQYEGYTDYYSEDYASYNYDEYSYSDAGSRKTDKNIFCCLFAPWVQPKTIEAEDLSVTSGGQEADKEQTEGQLPSTQVEDARTEASSASQPIATASPTLSPSPLQKENAAPKTLAVEPESSPRNVNFAVSPKSATATPPTPHMIAGELDSHEGMATSLDSSTGFLGGDDEKKQEEGDVESSPAEVPSHRGQQEEDEDEPPAVKGILKVKRCSMQVKSMSSLSNSNTSKKTEKEDPSSPNKRHLFPTYEAKPSHTAGNAGEIKSINFNPMARVLTIPSRKDIPLHQKAQVWWQKCDYDEFKKTGRIISKAMECGGSEIWLASSNAWGKRAATSQSKPRAIEQSDSDREYDKALSKYVTEEKKDESEGGGDSYGSKWWCKFGHSRRGLEHIASSSEGKARQQSVLTAIRMVMEEQKRQRANRTKDPNKLRNVAMQYTSWARDLALAAGSADAEAVASNFDPAAASRAHHFAKRLNVNTSSVHALNHALNLQSDAAGGGVAKAITSQILDANTHAPAKTNTTKPLKHDFSEDSLSKRASGYIPGGGHVTGFRSVEV